MNVHRRSGLMDGDIGGGEVKADMKNSTVPKRSGVVTQAKGIKGTVNKPKATGVAPIKGAVNQPKSAK